MTTYCIRTNWRWVVAMAAFIHSFLVFGALYNYSILLLSFQREFNTGVAATGNYFICRVVQTRFQVYHCGLNEA